MAAESGTAPTNREQLAYFVRVHCSDLPQVADQIADQFASVIKHAQHLTHCSPVPVDQITEQLIPVKEAIAEAGQHHGPLNIPPNERSVLLTFIALPKELVPYLHPINGEKLETREQQELTRVLPAPQSLPPRHPPSGWRTNAVGYWEPDPTHPDYPDRFKAWGRGVEEDDQNLDEDPRVAAVVEQLNSTLGPLQARFLSLGEYSETLYWDDTYEQVMLAIMNATAKVTEQAGNIAPPHVVMAYLIRRTILPDVAHKLGIRWQQAAPVWLRFIPSLNEFVMRFSDATGNQRKELTPLIERAQEQAGYLKPRRGRNTRKIDPVQREQAKTVAKLKDWLDLTHEQIAAFMGWEGSPETVSHRVRDHLGDGRDAMTDEQGVHWSVRTPDDLAPILRLIKSLRGRRNTMNE